MGLTVLIVDDQSDFRRLARALLENDGFVVVGEAADARGALAVVHELHPDVVLLDVRLPDGSGIELVRVIRDLPVPPVVVLTSTADYERSARQCGAAAFIPKAQLSGPALRVSIGVA